MLVSEDKTLLADLWLWLKYHHSKILAAVLTLQAAYTLYQSLNFMFFQLPVLEERLTAGFITQDQIYYLTNRALLNGFATFLSLFFAIHLTIIQSSFMQKLGKILAILVVIGNTQLQRILNQFGTTQLMTTTLINGLRSILTGHD